MYNSDVSLQAIIGKRTESPEQGIQAHPYVKRGQVAVNENYHMPLQREQSIPSDLNAAGQIQMEIEDALSAINYTRGEIFAIKMAVEEALVNAIKHGNQMDPQKNVRVFYRICSERFEVCITDEGAGFDPGDVPDPTEPENVARPCGRGLYLMRLYMTDVMYDVHGSTVAMIKLRGRSR